MGLTMPTDPATTAEEAQRARRALVDVLYEHRSIDDVFSCACGLGPFEFGDSHREHQLAALSSVFIDVPCETCGGKGFWTATRDEVRHGAPPPPAPFNACPRCSNGFVSRRAVDVWVDATREQT